MLAAEQCSRYHIDGKSLVIRDVAEEDAGKYTVLVGIKEHGLSQNLTLTLVVNGENELLSAHRPALCTSFPVINPCSFVSLCVCVCGCHDRQ